MPGFCFFWWALRDMVDLTTSVISMDETRNRLRGTGTAKNRRAIHRRTEGADRGEKRETAGKVSKRQGKSRIRTKPLYLTQLSCKDH
jgi:hypothetical protein